MTSLTIFFLEHKRVVTLHQNQIIPIRIELVVTLGEVMCQLPVDLIYDIYVTAIIIKITKTNMGYVVNDTYNVYEEIHRIRITFFTLTRI